MDAISTATIVVIDDDEVVRDSLKALLEIRNFSVVEYSSGRDFLNRQDDVTPGCLILDIHMPDMTGLDLLKQLRLRGDNVPAILITGRRETSTQAQADSLGAVALLDKPISHPALFAAISSALHR